jgi:hypothetical protein
MSSMPDLAISGCQGARDGKALLPASLHFSVVRSALSRVKVVRPAGRSTWTLSPDRAGSGRTRVLAPRGCAVDSGADLLYLVQAGARDPWQPKVGARDLRRPFTEPSWTGERQEARLWSRHRPGVEGDEMTAEEVRHSY